MITISWPLLIVQVVTFLVALVVVWKLFWGPLTRMMQERSQGIASDIARAESGRREIEALEAEYHRRLSEIEEKARQEINDAVQKGVVAKEEILRQARQEAQHILDKAQDDLARQRDRVIRELRAQVSEVSLLAVERLLGQGLDSSAQRKLLDQFIDDLDQVKIPR